MAVRMQQLRPILQCKDCRKHPLVGTSYSPFSPTNTDLWWHASVSCSNCLKYSLYKHPNKEFAVHSALRDWNSKHGKLT
jgi:hypothetical protein